jgi:uncharacterized protein
MPTVEFPPRYRVRLEKNALIPMADGTLIAADLFLPDAPGRFPVVLEYLPYRKDDRMAYRQQRHHYFAERGFACAWVDIRGTGASGGVASDEYSRQEQNDAGEIIAWLAAQPWSNGNVGMTGISYGGFNAIQVAMRRPPALKAIIPAAHVRGAALSQAPAHGTVGAPVAERGLSGAAHRLPARMRALVRAVAGG